MKTLKNYIYNTLKLYYCITLLITLFIFYVFHYYVSPIILNARL